jgi:hypothetical protein
LALRVDVVYKTRGWWLAKRYEDPAEVLDWFIVFEHGEPLAHADGWTDGFILEDELDDALEDLGRGVFLYRGEALSVQWLAGDEAAQLLTELEW